MCDTSMIPLRVAMPNSVMNPINEATLNTDHEFGGRVTAVYAKAEIRDNVVNYVTVLRFQPLTRLLSGALTEDQDRRP